MDDYLNSSPDMREEWVRGMEEFPEKAGQNTAERGRELETVKDKLKNGGENVTFHPGHTGMKGQHLRIKTKF